MATIPTITLNDGTWFPELGFGTFELRGEDGTEAIVSALETGYRLIDTAVNYKNEPEVGEALRRAVADGIVERDDVRITSKIPGRHHGFDEAIASIDGSRAALGVERVDLQLIHWPMPRIDKWLDTWRGMIEARERGLVHSIGVSNFTEPMLTRLIDETGVTPVVNQVELHPYFPQAALRAFHAEHGIRTESWSPIGKRSELLTEPVLHEIATAYGVTPGQVVLRWHIELGATPIPKSATPGRQRENADIFGFSLTDAEVDAISALERGRLWGGDPNTNEEM